MAGSTTTLACRYSNPAVQRHSLHRCTTCGTSFPATPGRGELKARSPHFWLGRVARSFDVVHRKAQDSSRARLHEWAASGRIDGFIMAYLGMRDDRLPVPIADLVPRDSVASYGTNFSAMSQTNLDMLSARGEQLTRSLLPLYCPELV